MGLFSYIIDQFRQPRGLAGEVVGHWMGWMNAALNRMAVELLEAGPGDWVLEIGFGHGKTVQRLADSDDVAFVAGIDPSETMLRQAARRNRLAMAEGRVELKKGAISDIPYDAGRFDKVLTVHTIYFWPSPVHDVGELHRVMKAGGRLVVAFRGIEDASRGLVAAGPGRQHRLEVQQATRWLEEAGFRELRMEKQKVPFMTGVCLVATK